MASGLFDSKATNQLRFWKKDGSISLWDSADGNSWKEWQGDSPDLHTHPTSGALRVPEEYLL